MSVMVATAYMEEAERFDWLVGDERRQGAGERIARPQIKTRAGAATLEEAFIALLPEAERAATSRCAFPRAASSTARPSSPRAI